MRTQVALVAVVCLVCAPCAHAPSTLGLSIVVRPPGPIAALERTPAPAGGATQAPPPLPASLLARFVPGAAPEVHPGPEVRVETAADLGVRMAPRPLAIPLVAPGTSARFSVDGARRGWVAKLEGQALPTPVYWDGKVMVGGGFSSHTFYGLDARTGRFLWSTAASDGGPSAGLAVEDKVLFNTESCTLFCVDPKTGRILWKHWLGDPVMGQPAAADGVVYSGHIVDGTGRYALSALRLADGRPLWRRELDADVLSAPVIARAGPDVSVYVTTMSGSLYRFRAGDGRALWRAAVDATSAPWIHRDRVLVSRRLPGGREQQVVIAARDGSLLAAGRALPAPYAQRRPDAGGVRAGWSYEGSRPVLAAGRAYFAMGAELRARDLETGEEVWRRRMPGESAERGITSPAIAGGSLVVGTRAGDLYGIDVDTGMTTFAFRVGEPIAAPPVVARGWVYCTTTQGSVFGLPIGDGGLDGWHMWGGSPTHTGPMASLVEPAPAARRPDDPSEGILQATVGGRQVVVAPRHTRIDVRVSGIVARVQVDQLFVNPTDRALDAAYLLPLPADAAVDALEMIVGGRVVRARVERRAQARATFVAARARGDTASLIEQERPNLFQERVANIPARAEVLVKVRLAAVLRVEADSAELVLPLVAAPRYVPGAAPAPVPPTRPGGALQLHVEVDAGTPLAEVTSPSHEVQVARPAPERAVVTLAPRADVPNRDFVLRHRVAAPEARVALLATRSDGPGTFALLLHPPERPAPAAVTPRELVVLVDASSSMSGRPFEVARALVGEAVRALSPRDTLRVLAFADRTLTMSPDPVAADADAAHRATRFLSSVTPHGGTELPPAVRAALGAPADPARLRVVLLVTDGNIGQDDEVLHLLAGGLGDARLHTVGLGAAPNRWLLERAAEIGRGTCTVVGLGEDPAPIGRKLAARLAGPVLTDLAIDWGGLRVRDVYPRLLPDLHAGEPLVVVGRFEGAGTGTVLLRGQAGGESWGRSVAVTLPERDPRHEALGSVWARRRVHELETAMMLRASDELREQIARVGLEHALVTSETSLVAVAHGAEATAPSSAPAAPATPAAAWSFEGEYWRDELGAYRAAMDAAPSPAATRAYELPDDLVQAELARPDGEVVAAARLVNAPASAYGRLQMEVGPLTHAQIASPPSTPRTTAAVQAVLSGAAPEIEAAYRAALERRRDTRGRLVVEITIRPDGTVAVARILRATVRDPTLQAAVLRRVRGLSFAPGPPQTVEFPIDLAPAR